MKKLILTIPIIFVICFVFGVQDASAQAKGKVIYTQTAMSGTAMLKGKLSKKKWMYFVLDFPNGKPAFNIVSSVNLAKFDFTLVKPDGTVLNDIASPNSANGAYRMKFKLKLPWSNSSVNQMFKIVIRLE